VSLRKQNQEKRLLLIEGYDEGYGEGCDLRRVLADPLDLLAFFQARLVALNLPAEPLLAVRDMIRRA